MTLTTNFYGARALSVGRSIQDFGLCDLSGAYVYSAKTRAKGLMVVTFLAPDSRASVSALKTIQSWTQDAPMDKWAAVGISAGERETLQALIDREAIDKVAILLDHENYLTRAWGISRLPVTFLIAGKTGRILERVIGDDEAALAKMKERLQSEIQSLVAAEKAAAEAAAAAKKAEEEKKAAAAAKPGDDKK